MDIWHERLAALQGTPPGPGNGKVFLFWRGAGVPSSLAMDILFALGLAARGHRPLFSLCDGSSPACNRRSLAEGIPLERWPDRCPGCRDTMRSMLDIAGLEYREPSGCLSRETLEQCARIARDTPSHSLEGTARGASHAGHHARASLARFLRGLPPEEYPESEHVLRAYLHAALVHAAQAETLAMELRPDVAVMQHGIYADWGPAILVFLHHGIDTMLWSRGTLPDHFLFRRTAPGDLRHVPYPQPGIWGRIAHECLAPPHREELDRYLLGQSSHRLRFHEPAMESRVLFERLELDPGRPVWALFTHLGWDGASFGPGRQLFQDQEDWLAASLPVMGGNRNVQWLLKVHPDEQLVDTVRSVLDLPGVSAMLPDNVVPIPSDSGINTYGLYPLLDGAVTQCGTPGLEMALLGKPVILATEAHYGEKGFTLDPCSREEYLDMLAKAPGLPRPDGPAIDAARRYAYHYFLERQMSLPLVREHSGGFQFTDFNALRPGACPELDAICDDLVQGGPFIRR